MIAAFAAWLNHWQTLVSGLLAVTAASVGAFLLSKQTAQVKKHERSRQRRRFNAVRATLPLALSGIISYVTEVTSTLATLSRQLNEKEGYWPKTSRTIAPPVPPVELVLSLQSMIESTADENLIFLISEMIGQIQVLHSRVGGLNSEMAGNVTSVPRNVESYIIQAATIHALASAMFRFARRQEATVADTVTWSEIRSALNLMGVRGADLAEVHHTLDLYEASGTSPLMGND